MSAKKKTTKKKTTSRARTTTSKKNTVAKKKTISRARTTTSKQASKKSIVSRQKIKRTAVTSKSKRVSPTTKVKIDKKDSTPRVITNTTLRGMKDITPKDGVLFRRVYRASETIAEQYGFSYVETPIVEQVSLFVRSIGKGTDVVDKEMYAFEDRDGHKVCLRPEGTASIARMYVNQGLHVMPHPIKMWYWGPMFRYDRPQAGRYRMFHQFGCETMGEHSPVIDAELIAVAYHLLKDLGIDTTVKINSIGTAIDRENYIVELVGYLRSKRSYLSDDSKKRLTKNPLRILDSKDENDRMVLEDAPQILDWLNDNSKKFFTSVLEYLDDSRIPYILTPTLVRGLDYYSDTVFELVEDGMEQGAQTALVGGGRYDGLVEQFGGEPTPAAGFSIGVERVMIAMKRKEEEMRKAGNMPVHADPRYVLFFAQLGEQARRRALFLIEQLRKADIRVAHNLAKSSIKAQLEIANKLNVTHTLILGQKEVQDGTIIIRNMDSGIQEIVDQKKIEQVVRKLFKN